MKSTKDTKATRTISLAKSGHKYVIRYGPGCENEVVDEIMKMADDQSNDLNWLDATSLSFQVTHKVAEGCFESLSPEETS